MRHGNLGDADNTSVVGYVPIASGTAGQWAWAPGSSIPGVSIPSIFSTFGGDGSAGNIVVSGATNFSTIDSPQYILQADDFTVNTGQTLTIDEGFAFIGVAGDCTINGIINADGKGAAGATAQSCAGVSSIGIRSELSLTADSVAPMQANSISSNLGLGGGGGAGGHGVNAGTATQQGGNGGGSGGEGGLLVNNAAGGAGNACNAYKDTIVDGLGNYASLFPILMASRGGGGGKGGYGTSAAGNGGAGGGVIYLEVAGALVFDGDLTADGAAGSSGVANSGGGGGGGGGTIIIRANTITTNTGTKACTGGAGGAANGGTSSAGGAGGTGYTLIIEL